MSPGRPKEIGISLLGLGNVGLGTYQIFAAHSADIERRLGAKVVVRHVLVNDGRKPRPAEVPAALLTTDPDRIFEDPEVAVVVELLGGTTVARTMMLRAIDSGRPVVTANKALLAQHGEELFGRALARGVDLHFEAAVCGGIPIIRTLREALASDRIEAVIGIVNGTTNYILTAMADQGASYGDALARAQAAGYAEADPTMDVSGADAAQKLSLLASLAFMARLRGDQVPAEGIEGLLPVDFAMAHEFGYVLKLLAIARKSPRGEIDARVHPALVPRNSPLAEVRGAFNAVQLHSAALGPSLLYGQGAGAMPTGSAVVSDVIDLCRNLLAGVSGRLPMLCAPHLQDLPLQPRSERRGKVYLRFTVGDEPGVLGKVATLLGEQGVSLASVVQRQPVPGERAATLVVFTHPAGEANVDAALRQIDALPSTLAPTRRIRIEEPETRAE